MARTPSCRVAGRFVALTLLALTGCSGGPKTHSVKGKVELTDGDVRQLAGSSVEFVPQAGDDETPRAFGEIDADGNFTLESLHKGKVYKGVFEGSYSARILLSDEYRLVQKDEDSPPVRLKPLPIHPRFLKPATSGLRFQVPVEADVVLRLSRQ